MDKLSKLNVYLVLHFVIYIVHIGNHCQGLESNLSRFNPQIVPSNHRMDPFDSIGYSVYLPTPQALGQLDSTPVQLGADFRSRRFDRADNWSDSSEVGPQIHNSSNQGEQTGESPKWSIMYNHQEQPDLKMGTQTIEPRSAGGSTLQSVGFDDDQFDSSIGSLTKKDRTDIGSTDTNPTLSLFEAQKALQQNLALQSKLLAVLNQTRGMQKFAGQSRRGPTQMGIDARFRPIGGLRSQSLIPTSTIVRHPQRSKTITNSLINNAKNHIKSVGGITSPQLSVHNYPMISLSSSEQYDKTGVKLDDSSSNLVSSSHFIGSAEQSGSRPLTPLSLDAKSKD